MAHRRPLALVLPTALALAAGAAIGYAANVPNPTGWLVTADAIARYSRDWSVRVNVTCVQPPPA